ncbi:MAG: restriction endonuclease [Pseudohongiella sp.]|uniref:restriction endonuclease n=1 Tax=Pseudohongiella sp. TaxID=1979412 RepID=UPI0034A0112B
MALRKDDGILDQLVRLPWWVSVIASITIYIFLSYGLPIMAADSMVLSAVSAGLSQNAYMFALLFLMPAPLSFWLMRKKRRLLDKQQNIESIRLLGWREFEELLAEAYRRQGYSVVENFKAGPDGGIDIRLSKGGHVHLVQCKHWKSQKVGVNVVREMLGLVKAEDAARAIVVTSGFFTQEAINFAQAQPVDLIDGSQLYQLISSVQRSKDTVPLVNDASAKQRQKNDPKVCPLCGSELVARVARKGSNAGNSFYGCASFPKCRHTEAVKS